MSLRHLRKPSLADKIDAQAAEAETVREKAESEDEKRAKIIKKKTNKN